MKVIVSNIGKQHVNALLISLEQNNIFARYFTSIASNKIKFLRFFPAKFQSKLKKRFYNGIGSAKIIHFPLLSIILKFIGSEVLNIKYFYKWYDNKVAQKLKKENYDILIGYETTTLQSFKEAKTSGKITVLDLAGVHFNFQNSVLSEIGVYKYENEVLVITQHKQNELNYTDYIIVLSSFAEKTVVDSGFPKEKIFKTYLGVNHQLFKPKEKYNLLPTKDYSKTFEIYFVGTVCLRKGLPFIVELFEILKAKHFNFRLTVIGPIGDYKLPVLTDTRFRYFSFVNHAELVKMHHELDLFIFPSHIDSWAQVVIEAMACGTPVLVSENTGAKDAVLQGGGFVLPVGETFCWINAIKYFYNNRSYLQEKGEEAAKIAKQYTWDSYHQQIFDVMTQIYKNRNEQLASTYENATKPIGKLEAKSALLKVN